MMKFLGYFIIFVLVGIGIAFFYYYRESAKTINSKAAVSQQSALTSKAGEDDWQIFESKEEGFQVYFPKPPKEHSKNVNQLSYHTYTSETIEKDTYLITVIAFPNAVPPNVLNELQNSILQSSPDSRLISSSPLRVNELVGNEFVIEDAKKETTTLSVAKGKKVYLLAVIHDKNKTNDEVDKRFFLNSFQFLP